MSKLQQKAQTISVYTPNLVRQSYGVWFRHLKVYSKNIYSNALPPLFEPVIFLVGIGLGLGRYIDTMGGVSYVRFLMTGLLVSASMFTSAFECTYGTFIRLKFDKVYHVMLGSPINSTSLMLGELFWASTKGFFFSLSVLVIGYISGIFSVGEGLIAPIVGFFNALMFASLGLVITSFVKSINHFSFFFTGLLSPMFFFAGVVFPLEELPNSLRVVSEMLPLTHTVRIIRLFVERDFSTMILLDLAYIFTFSLVLSILGIRRIRNILIL